MPLGVEDLPWIMVLLRPIAHKWKEVMMRLGVKNDYILAMLERSSDGAVLLNMGMSKWLQQAATLTALTEALSSPELGEGDLSSEVWKSKIRGEALISSHNFPVKALCSTTFCLFSWPSKEEREYCCWGTCW